MTSQPNPAALDFGELVTMIAEEVNRARLAAQAMSADETRLRIGTVRIRLGQAELGTSDDAHASSGVLLLDRYPNARSGWQLELDLGPRPADMIARPIGGQWGPIPLGGRPTLRSLVGDLGVEAIKGAGGAWKAAFEAVDVRTVDELIDLPADRIVRLVRSMGSTRAIELQYKARLLDVVPPPIPAGPACNVPIVELVELTPDDLRRLLGPGRVSAHSAEQLTELVMLLFTVLDVAHLRPVTLADVAALRGEVVPSDVSDRPTAGSDAGDGTA